MTTSTPNFNGVARAYRWLEYLTMGPLLEQSRFSHLTRLAGCSQALVLGDGDGRFTARLLGSDPSIRVEAVDLSRTMLWLLRRRCLAHAERLVTHEADARCFVPTVTADLVVTHYFLDCLSQSEVDALIAGLTPHLASGAIWLVSDFRIPGGLVRWPAWVLVRFLYVAFRLLTGLQPTRLPDHALPLQRCGFVRIAVARGMFGILTSEVWQRR